MLSFSIAIIEGKKSPSCSNKKFKSFTARRLIDYLQSRKSATLLFKNVLRIGT